jgi:DNA invertase Pin-like site-specific DNA recombinase
MARARKQGSVIGRPRVVTDRARVAKLRAAGKSLGQIAAEMGLAKTTVARIVEETAA